MVVICAQWRMGWWRGPNLLNGVFLLTLIRTLHPRAGDASCLEDLSYYPTTVHLSYVTSVASHMHQDLERVWIVLQIHPTVFQYATAFNQNISSRWNVVQNSSLPADFADQSALTQQSLFPMWGTWPPAAMTITSSDVVNGIANGVSRSSCFDSTMAVWYSNICFIGGTLIHIAGQGHVDIDQINIEKRNPRCRFGGIY